MKEVRIHGGLELIGVFEELDEPFSVGTQILERLQLLHRDAIDVLQHISHFVTVLDDLITEARVVILQGVLLVEGRIRRVVTSPILSVIGKHLIVLILLLLRLVNIY